MSLTTIEESAENALQSIQSLLSLMRVTRLKAQMSALRRYNGHVIEAVTSRATLLKETGDPDQGVSPTGAHSASRRQASGLSQIQSSRP